MASKWLAGRRAALAAFSGGCCMSAAALCESTKTAQPQTPLPRRLVRPRDLPMYPVKEEESHVYVVPPPSDIEAGITYVRSSLGPYSERVADFMGTAVSHTAFGIATLQQPENDVLRYAAIALGAVSGSVLAFRRGLLRKLTFPIVGAAGMAAVCYPERFASVKHEAAEEAKHFGSIGLIMARSMYADLMDKMANASFSSGETTAKSDADKQFEDLAEKGRDVNSTVMFVPPTQQRPAVQLKGDLGQGNPEDRDLYTTRS